MVCQYEATVPWWFVDHARGLRFWILWLGTSGMLYDLQLNWATLVVPVNAAVDAQLFARHVGGKPKVRKGAMPQDLQLGGWLTRLCCRRSGVEPHLVVPGCPLLSERCFLGNSACE